MKIVKKISKYKYNLILTNIFIFVKLFNLYIMGLNYDTIKDNSSNRERDVSCYAEEDIMIVIAMIMIVMIMIVMIMKKKVTVI